MSAELDSACCNDNCSGAENGDARSDDGLSSKELNKQGLSPGSSSRGAVRSLSPASISATSDAVPTFGGLSLRRGPDTRASSPSSARGYLERSFGGYPEPSAGGYPEPSNSRSPAPGNRSAGGYPGPSGSGGAPAASGGTASSTVMGSNGAIVCSESRPRRTSNEDICAGSPANTDLSRLPSPPVDSEGRSSHDDEVRLPSHDEAVSPDVDLLGTPADPGRSRWVPAPYLNMFLRENAVRWRISRLTTTNLELHNAYLLYSRHQQQRVEQSSSASGANANTSGEWLQDFLERARRMPVECLTMNVLGQDAARQVACFVEGAACSVRDLGAELDSQDAPDGEHVHGARTVVLPVQFGGGRKGFLLDDDSLISTPRYSWQAQAMGRHIMEPAESSSQPNSSLVHGDAAASSGEEGAELGAGSL